MPSIGDPIPADLSADLYNEWTLSDVYWFQKTQLERFLFFMAVFEEFLGGDDSGTTLPHLQFSRDISPAPASPIIISDDSDSEEDQLRPSQYATPVDGQDPFDMSVVYADSGDNIAYSSPEAHTDLSSDNDGVHGGNTPLADLLGTVRDGKPRAGEEEWRDMSGNLVNPPLRREVPEVVLGITRPTPHGPVRRVGNVSAI